MKKFTPPEFGAPLPPAHPSEETIELLRLRRSTAADLMTGPGPNADELQALLEIASRVPDHRRITPFRFIVFEGDARARAGEAIARGFAANEPGAAPERVNAERNRFLRAPVVIAVVSAVDRAHKTPEWEQVLTVGAVCQTMLIAASAMGFASQWITEWYAYDTSVLTAFGLKDGERIAGYVYLGAAKEDPKERLRPDVPSLITRFEG